MPKHEVSLPIRLPSPNVQEHWSKRSKRNGTHFLLLKRALSGIKISFPCRIKMIRQGKRFLDTDNLTFAFKGIRDSLCVLITGKKRGIGDDDPSFTWECGQEVSKIYAVKIEISWD